MKLNGSINLCFEIGIGYTKVHDVVHSNAMQIDLAKLKLLTSQKIRQMSHIISQLSYAPWLSRRLCPHL